jgi:hypothetical protein
VYYLLFEIFITKESMDNLNDKITLIRTELNLTQDPKQKEELNKQLNILNLRKEIEDIKKRIDFLANN